MPPYIPGALHWVPQALQVALPQVVLPQVVLPPVVLPLQVALPLVLPLAA